jgi:uncharacterized membrane-anchored protein YjiN (DUF445 family)
MVNVVVGPGSPGVRDERGRPASASERRRARQLTVAKRRATGLLAVVGVLFVVVATLAPRHRWLEWVEAAAVASLVGGLADWFAVTALFRRPLGLPIPHTAIVVERKDRFADTLGTFVQESFLTPEAVSERLRATDALGRVARWASDPEHAAAAAKQVADGLVIALDLVSDEDMHQLLAVLGRDRIDRVELAPAAGRLLRHLTKNQRHEPAVDAALAGLARALRERAPQVRRYLHQSSPWWLPGPVEDRMVNRLLAHVTTVLGAMAGDRDHPLRHQLDDTLATLADDLEHSDDLRRRGEALKAELLGPSELRDFAAALWRDTKDQLRAQAADDRSVLRVRLAAMIERVAGQLRDDPELRDSAQRGVDRAVRLVLERFDRELARLVSATITRWDAVETSRRLELLLGPDLQYIRINGTVVGAAAGVLLYAVSRALR